MRCKQNKTEFQLSNAASNVTTQLSTTCTKQQNPPAGFRMAQLQTVVSKFIGEYHSQTPKKLKLIDAYLFYILLTGIFQFLYCCLVGTFPFNSFLSGFISTISCFILGGKQRFIGLSHFVLMHAFVFQCACASSRTPRTNRSSSG